MPDDKIERLRIVSRGYELSATGTLPPSQYLKYLEHLRWRTISTSDRLPFRRFWVLGVVRSQVIEIHRPVSFDEELEVSMWMSRVGKTSMEFSHDLVRCRNGDLVGRSSATIVALDGERRPATIKEGAREYLVERDAVHAERLDTPPPDEAWGRTVDIRPSDHDLQQHVNHARYADFIEDTRMLCSEAGGYGPGVWNAPARKLTLTYEHETRAGDDVVARTWRTAGRERSVDFALVRSPGIVTTKARIEFGEW